MIEMIFHCFLFIVPTIIPLITLTIAQSQPDLNSPEGCFSKGECTVSLSVASWTVASAQECLELCREEELCNYFTFKEDGFSCEGFANCINFSKDTCRDCFSGGKVCEGKWHISF